MRPWVYLIFFLSGAAALIYEISWSRQLGLLFGHTVHAASVVLASYFAGMAFGYLLGARWCSRINPLKGYAIAEVVAGLWAVAIPWVIALSETSTFAAWLSHPSPTWQTAFRVLFSFLLLLPGTTALGVTLPMIAAGVGQLQGGMGNSTNATRVSIAYALNTAGALVGVLSGTMYLLISVGVCGSSYIAAFLSVLCALIALKVSPNFEIAPTTTTTSPARLPQSLSIKSSQAVSTYVLFLLAGLSGFCTLALQVLYTRMFSLVFHNSTYSFGIVIAVFLAALTLGGLLAAWAANSISQSRTINLLAYLLAAGAVWAPLSILIFTKITHLEYFRCGSSFTAYLVGATGLVLVVIGPGITMLGMALPLVWQIAGHSNQQRSLGGIVGQLTSVNTACAAAGALAASFLLLPQTGLWHAIVLIASLLLMAAIALLRRQSIACALIFVVAFLLISVPAANAPDDSLSARDSAERVLRRWNSAYGWIDVVQQGDSDVLKIRQNLHYRFGKTGNNAREYRQAHLPLLLHQNPKTVMFMGLGTGLTAGGAVPHREVEQIVVAELIPEVIEATRMLAQFNYGIIDHAKSTVIADDARHALRASDRKYDVIVSDLFVPWESESGYLYTVEHYRTAIDHLAPSGLFCQWLPMYQVGTKEFEMIANSFATVFPNVTLWWGKLSGCRSPVIALIGGRAKISVNSNQLQSRLDRLASDMGSTDPSLARWDLLVDHYAGDWHGPLNPVLNTDEFPRVEFSTPISNRDRKMIHTHLFEEYFSQRIANLPMNHLEVDGQPVSDPNRQHQRQRILFFGGR